MTFKGTPLFGQDSNPQYTSKILGFGGTILFWIIMLIVLIFAKPVQNKPKYKEVQIVLSSTPTVKKEEAPAPAEAASSAATQAELLPKESSVAENNPATVEKKTVTAEKKTAVAEPVVAQKKSAVTEKKTAVAEKKPVTTEKKPAVAEPEVAQKKPAVVEKKPAVTAPIEYAVDPMEAFAQQTQKKQTKEFDWSMFDDDTPAETTSKDESVKKVQNNEPLFSGSAATVAETSSQPVTSSSSTNKTASKSAAASTSDSLSKISNANFAGKAVNGVESQTTAKTAVSGTGKVMMEMSNGSSRALLDPAKPVINLSEAASATIDGSRTVKIRFRVVEAGNVPRGEIQITPESILTEPVKQEVLDQISRWKFEPADYTAYAEFEYKILKK